MTEVGKKKCAELDGLRAMVVGLSRWAKGIVKLSSNEHLAQAKHDHARTLHKPESRDQRTRLTQPFSWDALIYVIICAAVVLVIYRQCRMELFHLPRWPMQNPQCEDIISHGLLIFGTSCMFVIGSIFFQYTQCFYRVGILMSNRVVHSAANWEQHILRSTFELSMWVGCTVVARHCLNSVVGAILISLLSGAFLVTIGDHYSSSIKAVEPYVVFFSLFSHSKSAGRQTAAGLLKDARDESITDYVCEHFGPMQVLQILVFAYGHQIFTFICEHQHNIVVVFILSTFSGAVLAILAQAMSRHARLNGFADILRGRVYSSFSENWATQPLRSAVEIILFVFSVYLGNRIYDDFFVAILLGVLTHLVCVLAHLTFEVLIKQHERVLWNEHMGVLFIALIFATLTIFYVITFSLGEALASLLALTFVGVNIVLLSECCLALSCTAQLGRILRDRFFGAPSNWETHPARSMFEIFCMASSCFVIYHYTGRIFIAFTGSTWISIALIFAGSLINGDVTTECCSRRKEREGNEAKKGIGEDKSPASTIVPPEDYSNQPTQNIDGQNESIPNRFDVGKSAPCDDVPSEQNKIGLEHIQDRGVSGNSMVVFTMKDVQTHCSPDDCWIVVDQKVYDVTNFAETHPGGEGVVLSVAGLDATQQFHAMHGNGRALRRAKLMMKKYCIGEIRENPYDSAGIYAVKGKESLALCTPHAASSDGYIDGSLAQHNVAAGDAAFSKLRNEIMSDPTLWECRWADTLEHMARAVPFLMLTLACLWYVKGFTMHSLETNNTWVPYFWSSSSTEELKYFETSTWWIIALAGWSLGMFWHQAAFVAHDACHRGTPENPGAWHWFGCIYGSFVFGISTAMWGDEHYQHHVATRRPHGDPQFEYYPICLLSLKELDENHPADRFAKLLFRIQHIIFLPLAIIVGRINFHGISLAYAIKRTMQYYILPRRFGGKPRPQIFRPEFDLIGMAFYFAYQYALVVQIPFHYSSADPYNILGVLPRLIFFVIAQWTCGCLHLQLLVSHIGVECFTQEEQCQQSWFSHQVLTSRNVITTWWNSWYWGGLEYQIEHHLFPRLPRASLAKIAPRVKALCAEHNLPYRCDSQLATVLDVINDMNAIGILACEIPS